MKIADELAELLWSEMVTERDRTKDAYELAGRRLAKLNATLNKMKRAGMADHLSGPKPRPSEAKSPSVAAPNGSFLPKPNGHGIGRQRF